MGCFPTTLWCPVYVSRLYELIRQPCTLLKLRSICLQNHTYWSDCECAKTGCRRQKAPCSRSQGEEREKTAFILGAPIGIFAVHRYRSYLLVIIHFTYCTFCRYLCITVQITLSTRKPVVLLVSLCIAIHRCFKAFPVSSRCGACPPALVHKARRRLSFPGAIRCS
jgi:hypothetical protein